LKMSYAGISKGVTGLCATMILAAHANSPSTAEALLHELAASQPMMLQRMTRMIPDMLPKAYRWVGEMEEISSFVAAGAKATSASTKANGNGISNSAVQDMGGEELIYLGLAKLFERVDKSLKQGGGAGGEDVRVLRDFVEDAKTVLNKKDDKT